MPCFVSPKSKMYSVLDSRSSQIQTVQVSRSRLTDLNNGNPRVPLSHNKGNFIQGLDWQPQTMSGFPSPCFLSAFLSMASEGGEMFSDFHAQIGRWKHICWICFDAVNNELVTTVYTDGFPLKLVAIDTCRPMMRPKRPLISCIKITR